MCCKGMSRSPKIRYSSNVCMGMLVCLSLLSIIASPFVLMHGTTTWTKVLVPQFRRTQCTLTDVNMTSENVSCTCGRSCEGALYCIVITVQVLDPEMQGHQAVMYHSLTALKHKKCSIIPQCHSPKSSTNRTKLSDYIEELRGRNGGPFSCLRSSGTGDVIRTMDSHISARHIRWAVIMCVIILIDLSTCVMCAYLCLAQRRAERRASFPGVVSEVSKGSATYEMTQNPDRKLGVV